MTCPIGRLKITPSIEPPTNFTDTMKFLHELLIACVAFHGLAATHAADLLVGVAAPPLSPEESLRKLHVSAGFKVELVAAEPLVLNPVAFDWDARTFVGCRDGGLSARHGWKWPARCSLFP